MTRDDEIEHIEFVEKRIAKSLNSIEGAYERLLFLFENHPELENGIQYQIENAVTKLGFALATLHNWFDDPEEVSNSQGE